MALRTILTSEDSTLRKKSKPVTDFGARTAQLMDDLKDTLAAADGAGLAAPQVGILRRAVVVMNNDTAVELINPEITSREGSIRGTEGCLSVPGMIGYVVRPEKVTVKAFDRNGKEFSVELEAIAARCACHETDHLDGILYTDKAEDLMTEQEYADRYENDESDEES